MTTRQVKDRAVSLKSVVGKIEPEKHEVRGRHDEQTGSSGAVLPKRSV